MDKKLSSFQEKEIQDWLAEDDEFNLLVLNRDNQSVVGRRKFKNLEVIDYEATEYWCAMQYLDELEIPREDKNGETYSIVGRIKLLIR